MKPTTILAICIILLAVLFMDTVYTLATAKMTNAVCESKNKSWVTIDRCRLRAISRNLTTLTIEVTVLYPAHNIYLSMQLMKKANGYKPWLFDYKLDACAFMRRANHPFMKLIWNMIKDVSTVNHTCPYKGKQMLKDFYFDPSNFSLPFPSGEYLMKLTWIFDMKPQFVTNVYFIFNQDISMD